MGLVKGRRWRTAVAALLLAVSVGLAGGEAAAASPRASGAAKSGQPVQVGWLGVANTPAQHEFWAGVGTMVSKVYPNIHVVLSGQSFNDYFPKLTADVAAGDAPCLAQMQQQRMPGYAFAFVNLNSYIKEEHFPIQNYNAQAVAGLSVGSQIRALPFDFGPYFLFYNKSMFAQAGLSDPKDGWTLSQFMHDAQVLKQHSEYALLADPDPTNWLPFAASAFGAPQPVNSREVLDLTTSNLKRAFSWYTSLVTKYHYAPPISSVSNANLPLDEWQSGAAAMYVGGPWNMPTGSASSSFPKYGIVTMPVSTQYGAPHSVLAGSGFGITRSCPDKLAAFKALSVIIGHQAQIMTGKSGWGFPADSTAQSAWFATTLSGAKRVVDAADEIGVAQLTSTNWNAADAAAAVDGLEAFNGSESPSQVLETVQQQYVSSSKPLGRAK